MSLAVVNRQPGDQRRNGFAVDPFADQHRTIAGLAKELDRPRRQRTRRAEAAQGEQLESVDGVGIEGCVGAFYLVELQIGKIA